MRDWLDCGDDEGVDCRGELDELKGLGLLLVSLLDHGRFVEVRGVAGLAARNGRVGSCTHSLVTPAFESNTRGEVRTNHFCAELVGQVLKI